MARRPGRAGLLAALLAAALAAGAAAAGDALADKIQAASEAQQFGDEVTEVVKAQIVKQAPEAVLTSGTGDVATTGAVTLVRWLQAPGPNASELSFTGKRACWLPATLAKLATKSPSRQHITAHTAAQEIALGTLRIFARE